MADAPSELAAEITELEQKHADNPEGRYLVALANAYRKAGNLPHAERLLREGLKRHPESLSAHVVLGRCLADRGATREAADEFRYVLSIDPQNLIALRTLGELAASEGRTDDSARWYRELLAVDPMNEEARAVLESLREPQRSSGEERVAAPEVHAEPETFEDAAGWWEAPQQMEPESERFADASPEADLLRTELIADWPDGLEIDAPEVATVGEEAQFAPAASSRSFSADDAETADADDYFEVGGFAPTGAASVDRAQIDEDADEDEVITETIADLYARQGFYDRAADVYRELIRRGGNDPSLYARLVEMESRIGQGSTVTPAPVPVPDRVADYRGGDIFGADRDAGEDVEPFAETDAASLDAFSASFAHGFGGDPLRVSGAARAEPIAADPDTETSDDARETLLVDADHPVPLAPSSPDRVPEESAAAGPSITEYLTGLLSWVPGSRDSLVPEVLESPVEAPEPDFAWEQVTLVPDPALLSERDDVAAADDWEPQVTVMSDEQDDQGDQMVSAAAPHAAPEEEELFPWELPAPPASAPVAPVADNDVDSFSLQTFLPEEQPLEAPSRMADYEDQRQPERTGGSSVDDDEDLESFQAWLRNLKR